MMKRKFSIKLPDGSIVDENVQLTGQNLIDHYPDLFGVVEDM